MCLLQKDENSYLKFDYFYILIIASSSNLAFRTAAFSQEIDFSNYINKSENELIDDTHVNWVRSDYENAYVCLNQKIKTDSKLLRLLPRNHKFMITYIYARPRFGQVGIFELLIAVLFILNKLLIINC